MILDETRRWMTHLRENGEMVYSEAVRPDPDVDEWFIEADKSELWCVYRRFFGQVVERRRTALSAVESEPAEGRIGLFTPGAETFEGLAEGECICVGGKTDLPCYDMWIAIADAGASEGPVVVSWVPEWLIDDFEIARDYCVTEALMWLDDRFSQSPLVEWLVAHGLRTSDQSRDLRHPLG